MTLLNKDENKALYQKILSCLFGDPILIYTVVVMMSIMYHYRSSLTWVYGLAAWIIGALIFKLFDYISAHKLIGSAAYIALFVAFMLGGKLCVDIGAEEYPINFGVWFLTPQDALDYSRWYTLAMFIYFMIFMASVIYYFTKIRYRIFMNFLIFIIPFAIYGKEYEKMPTAFIMLLAIGYIVAMINCRQLTEKNHTVIIGKKTLWQSAAVYIVVFASIAAIIPKPVIEADRELLDQLIAADAFTDRLLASVSIFRDTSTGDEFLDVSNETILYFADADEPLRLKTTTYTTYDYANDSWTVSESDTRFTYRNTERDITAYEVDNIIQAVALAAEIDEDFAQKYGLDGINSESPVPAEINSMTIYTIAQKTQFAPVPPMMTELEKTSHDGEIAVTRAGLLYCVDDYFSYNESFTYEYCSEWFFHVPENKAILDRLSRDDYNDLLSDASLILYHDYFEQSAMLSDVLYESEFRTINYLDYNDNQKIYDLAEEITAGLSADYDKAKAIERYFTDNKYLYDVNYRKGKNDNVVDFIFDAKRGVCYEYATAMVLLARAAGIPARYAEGYNMSEQYANNRLDTNYVIKTKSAHGFPELYIRGAGWVSFEPTVSTVAPTGNNIRAIDKLSYAGIFLLVCALMFLLCMKLYPVISHKIFILRVRKMSVSDAAASVMRRVCRLCKLSISMTSHEAAEYIFSEFSCSVYYAADLFDKAVYGECDISGEELEKALEEYMTLYTALKNKKKMKNRKLGQST